VTALTAQHRWCLTGTPIQNDLDDLGSLVSFLKVPILENPATFRNFITRPIQSNSGTRFKNLRTLLESICLRRTKELLNLPEPVPQTQRLAFTPLEHAEYNKLLQNCRIDIDRAVSGHRRGTINSTFLESLLKLRLYCNNGSVAGTLDDDETLALLQQQDRNLCAYCYAIVRSIDSSTDTDGGILLSSCSHLVCRSCLPTHRTQKAKCPLCATETANNATAVTTHPGEQNLLSGPVDTSAIGQTRQYPSKLVKLLSDLDVNRQHKRYSIRRRQAITKYLTVLYFLVGRRLSTWSLRCYASIIYHSK
jgi:SNF2 family DNA or RNA helicase